MKTNLWTKAKFGALTAIALMLLSCTNKASVMAESTEQTELDIMKKHALSHIGKESKADISGVTKAFNEGKIDEDYNISQENKIKQETLLMSTSEYLFHHAKPKGEIEQVAIGWYNANIILADMYSDVELVWRDLAEPDEVKCSMQTYDTKALAGTAYEKSIGDLQKKVVAEMTNNKEWTKGERVVDLFQETMDNMLTQMPFEIDNDTVVIPEIQKCICSAAVELAGEKVDSILGLKLSDKDRVKAFLKAIEDAKSFDDQCSIAYCWANLEDCGLTWGDDDYIIAVMYKLLTADKYSPLLTDIWGAWRCLYQQAYWGISTYSHIPNSAYNEVKSHAYASILKHVVEDEQDMMAKISLLAMGGEMNLNRFGDFMFGNQVPVQMSYYLPKRIESILNEKEDKDKK